MTKVFCNNYDCKYAKDGECQNECISIGEDFDGGCNDYESYLDTPEYQEKYYIAVRVDDPIEKKKYAIAKFEKYGRKLEINGRIFYTQERISDEDDCLLTDARTGYGVSMNRVKTQWDKFLERSKDVPDVETLPLAVENERGTGYKLVEADTDREEKDDAEIH